jgi:hypothetical protein
VVKVLIPATRAPAWTGGQVITLDDTDDAYWRFWADLWTVGESVIVVEHDIAPTGKAIAELVTCSSQWCTQPYPYFVGTYHGLGCVKFTAELMATIPDLWTRVAGMSDPTHPRMHWCRLDAWSQQILSAAGHQPCRHSTLVEHLNSGRPSHGCT